MIFFEAGHYCVFYQLLDQLENSFEGQDSELLNK